MGVRGVWYSPDRRLRVELRDERGRPAFRVIDRTLPVGEFPSIEALGEFLEKRYGLGFADFVED
jgi:hypothetical protein